MSGRFKEGSQYGGVAVENRFAARPLTEDRTRVYGVRSAMHDLDALQAQVKGAASCPVQIPIEIGAITTEGFQRVDSFAGRLKPRDTIVELPRIRGFVSDIVNDPDARRVALVDAAPNVRGLLEETYPSKEKAEGVFKSVFDRVLHTNRRLDAETLGAKPNEKRAKTRRQELGDFIKLGANAIISPADPSLARHKSGH